jgi:glycosyltransferase involved in cell wall biosynthesis
MAYPLISVITPVYNGEKYIEQTISSVLYQRYPNIQYMVVDDGSTDRTPEILKMVGNGIMVVTQSNQGENVAVNAGLKLVRGKYFMYPNADDPLEPQSLFKLVDFMEENQEVLCGYPDWYSIGEKSDFRKYFNNGEYNFNYMVSHHFCQPSVGSIFRSSILKSVGYRDPQFGIVSDFDYWLRIGLAGKMAHIPQILATFRIHDNQQSGKHYDARSQYHINVMRHFWTLNVPHELLYVKKQSMAWTYLVAATVTDNKMKALSYLWTAFKTYPLMFVETTFWDALIKRAIYVFRR